MTPTITLTLAALSNVGKAPIAIRLDQQLFPVCTARGCATRHSRTLSLNGAGDLLVHGTAPDAWDDLRRFTQDLLAASLERE